MAITSKRRLWILYGIAITAGPVILAAAVTMGFTLPFDWEVVPEPSSSGTRTPNPSKIPWYWLSLQEMLVYADPFLAEIILPIVVPLAVTMGAALIVWGLAGRSGAATDDEPARLPKRHYLFAGLIFLAGIVGPYLAAMTAVFLILQRAR